MTRKRKLLYFICLPLLLIAMLIAIVFGSLVYMVWSEGQGPSNSGFGLVTDECHLVDYEITGDVIKFRYAVCFENNGKHDCAVSNSVISFKKAQLKGWVEYQDSFSANVDNEPGEVVLKPGEKAEVIYVMTGTYLGGPVNEQLKHKTVVLGLDYRNSNGQDEQTDSSTGSLEYEDSFTNP